MLARLEQTLLALCEQSVEALDGVCSLDALPTDHYLDADWSPVLLVAAGEADNLSSSQVNSLRRAFAGDVEVNPDYRDFADSVWEHPVNSLGPNVVAEIAADLARLSASDFPSRPGVVQALRSWPDETAPTEPQQYLRAHLHAASEFYGRAATASQAILTWWD